MRRILGWTGVRTSVVAFGLVAAAAGVTRADTIPSAALLAYDSNGTVGTTGVTGDASAVSIKSLIGSFYSQSNLNMGVFQTKALDPGQTVTFANTPFDIKFKIDDVNNSATPGHPITPNTTPIDVTGVLNGTLTGSNQSSVVATFDPGPHLFTAGPYANTLTITNNPLSIVPSSSNNGMTSSQATVASQLAVATPAPEPSTVVLFAATIAGLGFRHRLRRARAAGC